MVPDWIERYVDAWVLHGRAGGGDIEAMDGMPELIGADIRYEDVPTGALFAGHEGVRSMAAQAHELSADVTFHPLGIAVGSGFFAFESQTCETHIGAIGYPATGHPVWSNGAGSAGRPATIRRRGPTQTEPGREGPRSARTRSNPSVETGWR
jgi:hypothetical protein